MTAALIDTNIYSLAMRGDKATIVTLQSLLRICFSVISVGELLAGFKGGNKEPENRTQLNQFLDSPRVELLMIDMDTADFYADCLERLKRQGTPIPTNDIWIAALALQHGLKIYTRDQHFERIPGLGQINA